MAGASIPGEAYTSIVMVLVRVAAVRHYLWTEIMKSPKGLYSWVGSMRGNEYVHTRW